MNVPDWLYNVSVDAYNLYVMAYNRYVEWHNQGAVTLPDSTDIPREAREQQIDEWNAHVEWWNKEGRK